MTITLDKAYTERKLGTMETDTHGRLPIREILKRETGYWVNFILPEGGTTSRFWFPPEAHVEAS